MDAGYAVWIWAVRPLDAVTARYVCWRILLYSMLEREVFTAKGTHEMDAAIMDGAALNAGAVSLITGIKNPIQLARDVMEQSPHVF